MEHIVTRYWEMKTKIINRKHEMAYLKLKEENLKLKKLNKLADELIKAGIILTIIHVIYRILT